MSGPLTAKYGTEVTTVYSGNVLNRLSYLREDLAYLQRCFESQSARFLPLREFNPLLTAAATKLHWLELPQVREVVGEPYARSPAEIAATFNPKTDASGVSAAQVLFLGVDEDVDVVIENSKGVGIRGAPRFAVDVTVYEHALPELKDALNKITGDFRTVLFGVKLEDVRDYNIVAEARIILDWINRMRFCGGCGNRNLPVWGGWKLMCPESATGRSSCPSHGTISNISFPRTDCCVIMAVLSHDGEKVLIGKGKRFRGNMYSCLAGFLESGESIEDCVRREVFEEAGVTVGRVVMHSSQPWPYPANLMVGCIAEVADASTEAAALNLGHDEELTDAKWVTREDLRLLCENKGDFDFTLPPKTSIAWQLLNAAAHGTF